MLRLGIPAPAAFTTLSASTPASGDSSVNAATTSFVGAALTSYQSTSNSPFYKAYTVAAGDPVIALDFKNGQYWDGTSVSASPSALISGGTVVAGSGLRAALSVTATGAHLSAYQLAAKTIVVITSGGSPAGSNNGDGVISYGSDAPLFWNGSSSSPNNTLISYLASPATTLAMVQGTTTVVRGEQYKRVWSATAMNASGRKLTLGGSGIVVSDASVLASPSTVTLGSYAGQYVYGTGGSNGTGTAGFIELILIYNSFLSNADFRLAASPRSAVAGSSTVIFPQGGYIQLTDASNALKYTKTQPWSVFALVRATSYPALLSSIGYQAGILWTNSSYSPNGGYEGWIDSNGKLRVRIMANFSTPDYLGVIGTTDLVDGNPHVVAFTYNGSGSQAGIAIYVDGVAETLTYESGSQATLTGDIAANAHAYTIGNQLGGGGGTDWSQAFMWPGYINAITQQNVAQSASYVAAYSVAATVQIPAVGSSTVYYLGFREATGAVSADTSGHGYTATLTNGAAWTPTASRYTIVGAAISGGSLDGAAIGSASPSAGAFTTLSAATPIAITSGGTGAATAAAALTNLGAASLAGATFTGPISAPTPAAGDSSTNAATTAFLANALTSVATIPTTGGTTTLTTAQYLARAMIVTGTLTSAAVIVVPTTGNWIVANRTTGAFTLTVKTASGTGVAVSQGLNNYLVADGTNVVMSDTDFAGVAIRGATIDSTPVGGTTPSSGVFTSILSSSYSMNGAAGSYRGFYWQTAFSPRVSMQVDGSAETGANAGSNFQFNVFDDSGNLLSSPFSITRASGVVSFFSVAISGGAINGTVLGGTTPAAGTFSTLTATAHTQRSTATGLTAAGTTQATALALTKTINVIATAAASSGVVLPNGGIGAEYIVVNRGANTVNIYPATGGTIDALAANAATTAATVTSKRFVQVTATQYYTA